MARKGGYGWVGQLSPSERLELAEKKVEAMLDLAIDLVHLHASNQIVCYSPVLKSQIPLSHAGVAFRIFSRALIQRELTSVCTFWDTCSPDRNSIPTVIELIDADSVRELIHDRKAKIATDGRHLSAEDDDQELLAWLKDLSDRSIAESAMRRVELLNEGVLDARTLVMSHMLIAAREFRDRNLAHNLSTGSVLDPSRQAKYGDEGRLLEATILILEKLNTATRNSSFDWSGTREIASRNAHALWANCKISVLE